MWRSSRGLEREQRRVIFRADFILKSLRFVQEALFTSAYSIPGFELFHSSYFSISKLLKYYKFIYHGSGAIRMNSVELFMNS